MRNLWFIVWRDIVLKLMFLVMVSSEVIDAIEAHFLHLLNMNFSDVKHENVFSLSRAVNMLL